MDFGKFFENCILIGLDALLLGVSYNTFKRYSNSTKKLKEAQILELNGSLLKKVQDLGESIPYAVVCGKVKALGTSLHSQFHSHVTGVIQETSTQEHKMVWIPWMHAWNISKDNLMKRQVNQVPFCLYNKAGIFKKSVTIEVLEPLLAEELNLTEVAQEFRPHDTSLGEAFVSVITREHTVGYKSIEKMLLEDTSLTAIGKIVIENGEIKVMRPGDGFVYYVTPMTYSELVQRISQLATIFKVLTISMLVLNLITAAYFARKGYLKLRRFINEVRDRKKRLEARKANRLSEQVSEDANPKCVVCLEFPVEIIVLECGHACLCLNCADNILNHCPVCRSDVARLIPVYLP